MIKTPLIGSDQLLFTTARIQTNTSVGTAFFFQFSTNDGKVVPCLVTNKHVVDGTKVGNFWVHTKNVEGYEFKVGPSIEVSLSDFSGRWTHHPDPSIDLCIMPFQPLVEEAKNQKKEILFVTLDGNNIPNPSQLSELFALSNVVMVGYPIGLWP
jgi:hypothetical protein